MTLAKTDQQGADSVAGAGSNSEPIFTLPETGEALLTPRQVAAALAVNESSVWEWAKSDPDFPRPVRRGERFTRFRLTDLRAYIAAMTSGEPKASPAKRGKSPGSAT